MTILLYNSLLKINYLYHEFWTKENLSFLEAVVRKCSIRKLHIKFCQSSLAILSERRLRHRCISVNLAKFFKKPILQNIYKWLFLDFAQFYMSRSIIYFIKRNSRKRNYYLLNVFNRISTSPKEIIRFENATFHYIFFRRAPLEIIHWSMGAGMKWMNENLWFTSNKIQTSNEHVKVYLWSTFTESHHISDIKDLRISTLYKKVHSWFLDKSKFWFFPEVSRAKVMTF